MKEPELFLCERRACRLTAASCAATWTAAQRRRPDPWEGSWHCRACPVGAANAGKPAAQAAVSAADEALRRVCSRCLRLAQRIVHGRLCVSCYNRELEARIGRNAKGGVPRLCGKLYTETLAVNEGGRIRVQRFDSVISMAEAMVVATKRATGQISFGRPGVSFV